LLVLLDWILSKEGYQVKTAKNAYAALDLVDQEDIRVAILDIQMYPIDGVALARGNQKAVAFNSSDCDDGLSRDGHKEQLHEIRRDELSHKTARNFETEKCASWLARCAMASVRIKAGSRI
jgi:PleD family two-component response regulator